MIKPTQARMALLATICALSIPAAVAQSPGTPVELQSANLTKEEQQVIVDAVLLLRDEGKIIDREEIGRQLETPQPETVNLASRRTGALSSGELAVLARATSLRVGYMYLCPRCDDWHVNLAGGYAVADDIIVTCDHVVETRTRMREGYLVAMDHDGRVAAASAILARSKAMDAAVVKVAGAKFTPVALNQDVAQGAPAFCFSHPLRQRGYFSTGIVNRFYWNGKYKGEEQCSLDALRHLRVDFSTEWAPGSSGAPLLDRAGNVIAHVSTIANLGRAKNSPPLLTMRTGIPAKAVESLIAAMKDPVEIKRIAMLDADTKAEAKAETKAETKAEETEDQN
jgi:S1-C subfamily serine protease